MFQPPPTNCPLIPVSSNPLKHCPHQQVFLLFYNLQPSFKNIIFKYIVILPPVLCIQSRYRRRRHSRRRRLESIPRPGAGSVAKKRSLARVPSSGSTVLARCQVLSSSILNHPYSCSYLVGYLMTRLRGLVSPQVDLNIMHSLLANRTCGVLPRWETWASFVSTIFQWESGWAAHPRCWSCRSLQWFGQSSFYGRKHDSEVQRPESQSSVAKIGAFDLLYPYGDENELFEKAKMFTVQVQ